MKLQTVFNKNIVSYQKGTLGYFLLFIAYVFLPWFTNGVIDQTLTIFGLMFLCIAVMRGKGSNTVLGGLFCAFMGIVYLAALAGFIELAFLWLFAILLTVGFFIFELGLIKFGPTSRKSDAFQLVPLTLLSFILLLGIIGKSNLITFNTGDIVSMLNYLAMTMFVVVSMLDVAGWKLFKSNNNKWITMFAAIAVITAFLGIYGLPLVQWT